MIPICSHIDCAYYYQFNPPRGNYYCSQFGTTKHVAIGNTTHDFVLEKIQTSEVDIAKWYGITTAAHVRDVINACPHIRQLTLLAKLKQI